jgi:hypothetical protein
VQNLQGIAQNVSKYQITLLLSPSIEGYNPRNKDVKRLWKTQGYQTKFTYNFGVEYKKFLSPMSSFSTGLIYQNKGYRAILSEASAGSNGLAAKNVFVLSVYYLMIPANLNFYSKLSKRSMLIYTVGLTNGIYLSDNGKYKRMDEEQLQTFKDPFTNEGITDQVFHYGIFSKRYTGLNLAAGYLKYIKAKMVIEFQLQYQRQLNKSIRKDAPVVYSYQTGIFYPKFDSFALNFRIGYYFNKQIKTTKEGF